MTSSPARDDALPGPEASTEGLSVVEAVEDGVHYAYHDPGADGLATTVALAVAEVAEVPPTELVRDISEYVDPDGLNRIFSTRVDGAPRMQGHVVVYIRDYEVRVDTRGEIAVTPPAQQ